jgi:hypothetical protein
MKLRAYLGMILILSLFAPPGISLAQQRASSGSLDPDAMEALNRMGAYLRTLKAYRIQSDTERDEVLQDGQVATFAGTADLLVETPNRMRADITNDRKARMFFYDGRTFTLFAPRMAYYATVPVPGTLLQLANTIEEKYGIEFPLVDLILWGTDQSTIDQIRAARDLGPSTIEGTSCQHYAFRQEGLDWQLWLQLGPNPLPRKLVLTTLTDEARPRYTSVFRWDLAPAYNEETFTFVPPENARKIDFAEYAPAVSSR